MSSAMIDFIAACVVMGLGIGTDVALATMLRAKQLMSVRKALFWIMGVSLTHTLFPMIGYLLTYFSIQLAPMVTPLVGLLAFLCIAHFLWHELKEVNQPNGNDESRQLMVSLTLILAVSWDALWSGPAKSAQVVDWSTAMIWGSFVLVGVMVLVTAVTSWLLGGWLLKRQQRIDIPLATPIALWLQYSIIGYFGLLALLRYTFALEVSWWQVLMVSAVTFCWTMLTVNGNSKEKVKHLKTPSAPMT